MNAWMNSRKKVPMILQTEAAECGLACAAMIAGFYGHHISLSELRQTISVSLKGLNLRGMIFCADQLGFNTRPVRVELDEASQLTLPAIVHMNFDHFVVLKKVTAKHAYINDPANGEIRYTLAEFSKQFTGVALEMVPSEAFKPKKVKKETPLLSLFKGIPGLIPFLGQIFGLSVALELFTLLIPYFTQVTVDNLLITEDVDFLTILGSAFIVLVLFRTLAIWLRGQTIIFLSSKLSIHMMSRMFRHLMRLESAFFEKRHVGDIQSRFGSLDQIKELMTSEFMSVMVDGLMVTATIAVMFAYSPTLAGISCVSILIYLTYRLAVLRYLARKTSEMLINKAKEDSLFLETVRGIVPLKNFGKEPDRQSVWLNAFVKAVNSEVTIGKIYLYNNVVQQLLKYLEYVIVVWISFHLILAQDFTVGMLLAYLAFRDRVSTQSGALIDKYMEFRLLTVHLQRISDIIDSPPEADYEGMGLSEEVRGELNLHNIAYRYADNEAWVLKDLNMDVAAGESVAITGPSGAGKSTLLKIMLGLLEPLNGEVRIDGVNIRNVGMKHYRDQIAVVMQDDSLFSGTLRDNITMFDPKADEDLLKECTKTAGIYDDIMQMPMGFSSLVGDMGSALSGGQMQRVLLARALYKQPKLLFLDEATSHLDSMLERKVSKAIQKMGITRVIIAHRQETIRLADRVIELQKINHL